MKDFNIFSNAWCNQVFDGRNQNYGAYQLRKSADGNTINGFIVSVCFSAVSLSFPLILTLFNPKEKAEDPPTEYTISDFNPPVNNEETKIKEIIKPSLRKKFDENAVPLFIDSTEVSLNPNPQDDSNSANSFEGDTTAAITDNFNNGNNSIPIETVDTNIYLPVGLEIPPKFPGDEKGMVVYFKKATRYPGDAYSERKTGTVYISFLISKCGSVSEATVLKGVPGVPSFENEALRVVNRMPNWSPGMQNGKPVTVRFTVPVSFNIK